MLSYNVDSELDALIIGEQLEKEAIAQIRLEELKNNGEKQTTRGGELNV